jgi:hypothetical protein
LEGSVGLARRGAAPARHPREGPRPGVAACRREGARDLVRPKEEEGWEKRREKRKKEKREKKKKKKKKKGKRKIEEKGNKGGKNRKGIWKIRRIFGKIRRRGFADFSGFLGYRRQFQDGGDGEADRPVGPRRARDSRRGGRPRCWGDTRRVTARAQAMLVGFAARAPKGKELTGVSEGGLNELSEKVLKTRVVY